MLLLCNIDSKKPKEIFFQITTDYTYSHLRKTPAFGMLDLGKVQ